MKIRSASWKPVYYCRAFPALTDILLGKVFAYRSRCRARRLSAQPATGCSTIRYIYLVTVACQFISRLFNIHVSFHRNWGFTCSVVRLRVGRANRTKPWRMDGESTRSHLPPWFSSGLLSWLYREIEKTNQSQLALTRRTRVRCTFACPFTLVQPLSAPQQRHSKIRTVLD